MPLLNTAFQFADDHGLRECYRAKFAGISLAELTSAKADKERRGALTPVWDIANELIVGRYFERVLGWRYVAHEPQGNKAHRGDWEFDSPSGRRVFVEVKSLAEPVIGQTGVYSRSSKSPKIRSVLKGAYVQLPEDDRATVVVLVGRDALSIPFGIMHGDLFQALFGRVQVTFPVMGGQGPVRMGPSFRDMFVHGGKHRRLGFAAGLVYGGDSTPSVRLYGVHNPYAKSNARLPATDFEGISQFIVDDDGSGEERAGLDAASIWQRMR